VLALLRIAVQHQGRVVLLGLLALLRSVRHYKTVCLLPVAGLRHLPSPDLHLVLRALGRSLHALQLAEEGWCPR
jgi:hypothetical protein